MTRVPEETREDVEREVLDVVRGLVAELGGASRAEAVRPEALLDRDLGLGSLERVELLLRLERAFGVRLPDAVMASADNSHDLAAAILAAEPGMPEPVTAVVPVLEAGRAAPTAARTLVEVLRWHVEATPDRTHIFLREEDGSERAISYEALWRSAIAVAAGLRTHGIDAGDRVALMLRTEEAFFSAFFGALLAGGIPVPIYPPVRVDRLEEYAARQTAILQNAEAGWLLTFREAERVGSLLRARVPSLRGVTAVDRLAIAGGEAPPPRLAAEHSALIQYTSGSTGAPKGVLLSHANLLANIRAIGEALAVRGDDIHVSWLPLYHDMGLIGSWLGALYFGVPVVILSPLMFLARPARWLWALSAHRGTISAAPNFAFDLCARRLDDAELRDLDLGAWRLALNGSEPVSPETIERFARRFAPYGFRPEAMCPAYGLAEAAVALTLAPPGRLPRVDCVERASFERAGLARPVPPEDPIALRFASCGRPLAGHEVRIVDETGRPVGDRIQGGVEFRGPSVTAGYYRNPEVTRAALHDGWFDSGDLGYWADGELFITGRRKDMIIKAGRNVYPQEVEEIVGSVPGIRRGCVAAFGVADPAIGTERLVIVAETHERAREARERLRATAVDRVVAALGSPPDALVLGEPGSVLKTPSGKIRRGATREAYLQGKLDRRRRPAWLQWARLVGEDVGARLRRATGLAAQVVYTAYVGLLLGITLPVLWLLVLAAPRRRAVDRLAHLWCRSVLALVGCRLRVEGLEHAAGAGPAVLVANHASYTDVVALLAGLPTGFRFVAKRELLSTPVVGTVIRKSGHLTVDRTDISQSVTDAKAVVAALQGGASLLVFPEGTFLRAPTLLPFRLGAFKAAVESGRPVLPVAIRGTREILPAYTWLLAPGRITVTIGAPILPDGTGWPEMVRLRDRARAEIACRLEEKGTPC